MFKFWSINSYACPWTNGVLQILFWEWFAKYVVQVWSYHDNLIQQLFDIVSNNLCISNSSDDGKSLRDLTHDWPAKGQSLNLNDNTFSSPYVVEYIDCDQKKGSGARIDEWYVRLCSSFLLILISELVIHKIVRTLLRNHTKIARRISQKTKQKI